jgi:hypothetical protein
MKSVQFKPEDGFVDSACRLEKVNFIIGNNRESVESVLWYVVGQAPRGTLFGEIYCDSGLNKFDHMLELSEREDERLWDLAMLCGLVGPETGILVFRMPENGRHPKEMPAVYRLLWRLTRGPQDGQCPAYPKDLQIVCSTLSPFLLDMVMVGRSDGVLVCRKIMGLTAVDSVSEKYLESRFNEYLLGQVWLMHGEDGLVGR